MQVVLTFSMQGVGNFTNTAVLLILMVIYKVVRPNHHNKAYPYPPHRCMRLLPAVISALVITSLTHAVLCADVTDACPCAAADYTLVFPVEI